MYKLKVNEGIIDVVLILDHSIKLLFKYKFLIAILVAYSIYAINKWDKTDKQWTIQLVHERVHCLMHHYIVKSCSLCGPGPGPGVI